MIKEEQGKDEKELIDDVAHWYLLKKVEGHECPNEDRSKEGRTPTRLLSNQNRVVMRHINSSYY